MRQKSKDQAIGKPSPGIHAEVEELGLAEEAVKKAGIEYRVVFEAMGNATALIEDDLTIAMVNGEFEKLSGYSRKEIEGKKTLTEFLTPYDAREIKDYFSQKGEGDNPPPKNYIILFTNKQGEPMEAVVTLTLVPQFRKIILTLAELRKLREAEESLKRSEARFRSLFESSPIEIALSRGDSLIYVNPAFLRMFGLDETTELQGRTFMNFIAPVSRPMITEHLERRMQGQDMHGTLEEEAICLRQDGTTFPVQIEVFSIDLPDGPANATFIRDITERKLADEALKQSEEKYRSLVVNLNDVIFTVNAEGRITYISPVVERFAGYKAEEIVGQPFMSYVHPEDLQNLQESFRRSLSGQVEPFEFRLLRKDGASLYVRSFNRALAENGQVNLTGVLSDITERKRAEERLRESFAKLAKTFEQTVESLASIAEMRDPYTAGHQVRVASLACKIASEIGMSTEQIDTIRTAALLHDIGKIIVPPEILNKPGVLNILERSFVEAHAQASYDILKNIEFGFPIAEIILQHHEKLDGSGYPRGLSGERILKEARILTVADIVEAMASNRPYRPALPLKLALEEISRHKGTLYDADVVDACLRLFLEKGLSLSRPRQPLDKRALKTVFSKGSRAG